MKKTITINQYYTLEDNNIFSYKLTQDGFEIARYWSMYGENKNQFLMRIYADVQRIIKMYQK